MTATMDPSARDTAAPSLGRGVLRRVADGMWSIAGALAHPLVPEDYLDLFDPLRSGAELRGRIVAVERETSDAVTLVIRPGRGWRRHQPGQYIRIGVDVDGVRNWRAYSLTSRTDGRNFGHEGTIAITVKSIEGGLVSNHLVRHATAGTIVVLDQATGDFVMPAHLPTHTLFLTAGSGITPVMGMIRNHLHELDDVVLLHSAPTPADVIFADELRALADAGRLRLIERHTDDEGILGLGELDELVPDWRERHTWACGPTALLDDAESHWEQVGVSELLHVERFRPAITAVGEGGTISFMTSGVDVDADGSTTILDAGEEAGVLMPSGCRMGICFRCVARLSEGAVRDLRTGDVTTAELGDDVRIQTCVSAAAGQCDIEL